MQTARCGLLAGRPSKELVTNVDDQRAVGTSRSGAAVERNTRIIDAM
jgi:hypothetical protein